MNPDDFEKIKEESNRKGTQEYKELSKKIQEVSVVDFWNLFEIIYLSGNKEGATVMSTVDKKSIGCPICGYAGPQVKIKYGMNICGEVHYLCPECSNKIYDLLTEIREVNRWNTDE